MDLTEKQQELISVYKKIVKEKNQLPVYADFLDEGITRDTIRHHFGGIKNLKETIEEEDPDLFKDYLMLVQNIFSVEKMATATSEKKIYVVTTAVAEAKAHIDFLSTLEHYCSFRNAELVIMPCESVTNSFENETAWFDPIFNESKYKFLSGNLKLNENISLCSIQVSAKQIKSTTGLARLGNREGSYIFASPKQFLDYIPAGNSRENNYSIMTPGACTLPNYYSNKFVSKRLSYIAEYDHTFGAIIIEIQDDKIFHFRQIQTDLSGSFIDCGVEYSKDGSRKNVPVNIVFGDLHSTNIDYEVFTSFMDFFKPMQIEQIFLHDVFDGYSISHHVSTIKEKALRHKYRKSNLVSELNETMTIIEDIDYELKPKRINIVKSNHDEFLSRYLAEGRYVNDPENHEISLSIAKALFTDEDILAKGFEVVSGEKNPDNWIFLDRSSSVKIGGIECGSHGDLGTNGAKPSLSSLENVYGNCVVGHNHTAAIQRGVFRVGTLSKLDMGYNRGPSSWTHTCCLVYENGQRQLVNYVGDSVVL